MGDQGGVHELLVLAARTTELFARLESLIGFRLPEPTKEKFLAVHASVTKTPHPPTLARLTVDGGSRRDWLTDFCVTVLDNT